MKEIEFTRNDFEMIIHQFDEEITIYPIGDVHLGSIEHDKEQWEKFCNMIQTKENSYIILLGDLINNSTKSSIANVFDEILRPFEQKRRMINYLLPIKDKILCAVSGNHERRSGKDCDNDPMYDIMCKLDLECIYRPNIAFMKIQIGKLNKCHNNKCYTFCITHGAGGGILSGATINRNERFSYVIDNLDCLVVGHTHNGIVSQPTKIVIDARNNTVNFKAYKTISTQSWLKYGGYAGQKMLLPKSTADCEEGQKLVLLKEKKYIRLIW